MAYQTGSVTSTAGLISTIENFAQANGWTLSGGVLSAGDSFIKLTDTGTFELQTLGANSSDFTQDQAPHFTRIKFDGTYLPATYYLFAFQSPACVFVVVNYGIKYFQWTAFGDLTKYGNWTGGNFFGASVAYKQYYGIGRNWDANGGGQDYDASGALFFDHDYAAPGSLVHCELDTDVWCYGENTAFAQFSSRVRTLKGRGPNQWNQQATLLPLWIWKRRPDNFWSVIGRVPNIRALRIDNYDAGDIITIASDQWMVFPWFLKDTEYRNGRTYNGPYSSGTFGWAIAYDGP